MGDGSGAVDVLVVGGGPAGTAAAFRARELEMSVLVVDYDDLMKRIRDYSKDKLILPSFGGGDQMCFPAGGELVSCLHFAPMDKDDMCAEWKARYVEHGIETKIGVELTELEPLDDGGYRANLWNHKTREAEACEARHVVLALGRGVPRRFDIPGNTEGIAYRLSEPEKYVGRPACVIGGGTSAAEAVIAISEAKSRGGDSTSVYWSYRGDKMPRISKALADSFFSAYVGNGNIRYFRRSEPAAVFTADDREEYLAIRVDRRQMENRPSELTMLEFPKDQCVAAIGEDIPETLLNSFGIHMVTGGAKSRKRMVVNRYLETCQPNIYLVGDLLSQAYFETEDFEAKPEDFREVKHRGNIKSALRDGVLVAQVIRQRLDGKSEIDTEIAEVEADSAVSASKSSLPKAAASEGPPGESLGEGRQDEGSAALLIRELPTGVQEEEFRLTEAVTTIGRAGCDLSFPEDKGLSDVHASVSSSDEGYLLRDDGGATGVFLKAPAGRKLAVADRDLVRVGRQFLLFSAADSQQGAELVHFDAAGKEIGRHPIGDKLLVLGRDAPDISLDGDDETLSRRHLAVSLEDTGIQIKDLKSVNGSYLKVRGARKLEHGDRIRLGQQSFIFSEGGGAVLDEGLATAPSASTKDAAASRVAGDKETQGDGGPTVTFKGSGEVLTLAAQDTVCEAAEAGGVAITAECHSGICGSDPIRILSGAENLAGEMSDQERETLEEICDLEPGPCRLACMVRVKGAVEVELIKK